MLLLTELPSLNAIRVGMLFHKPSAVHALLAKSVRLVAHEHLYDGESTIGFGGSCTLVSYEHKAFIITTRHQLHLRYGQQPPEGHFDTIRFATSEGGFLKNIPVDRCFHEQRNVDEDYHDLLFFGVQQEWLKGSADRAYFLPLEPFSTEDRVVSFFYGHPMSKSEVEYEPLHIHVRCAYIDGHLDREFRSHAEYFRRYSYEKTTYEMNGFSGGAVFSLFGSVDNELRLTLDGIIIRAGCGYLHAIDSNYLLTAIAQFEDRAGRA